MKRGTPNHPKVDELAARLKLKRWGAVGLLELLWHATAQYAHAGDIGRFTDDAIAKMLCYDDASTKLVSALVATGWVDRCACHRLRIHDWPDHADQTVERVLAKRGQAFIQCYDDASTKLAGSYDETSQPLPLPLPLPKANSLLPTPLPDALLGVEGFEKGWEEFGEHRKQIKAPLTPLSAKGILETLSSRPQDSVSALKMAVRRGWRGFEWGWFDKEHGAENGNGSHRPQETLKAHERPQGPLKLPPGFESWLKSKYPDSHEDFKTAARSTQEGLLGEFRQSTKQHQ
jgi:hypothetical protein